MSSINHSRYCNVYVWLGRNAEGKQATAVAGGKQDQEARCGHVALEIIDGNKTLYVSLWPGQAGSEFVQTLHRDYINEGGAPDSVIRLHHLDVPKMIAAFGKLVQKQKEGKVQWVIKASAKDKHDITQSGNTEANCATCVYAILKAGGLTNSFSKYSEYTSNKGPKDAAFYKKTRCDIANVLGGVFNAFFWNEKYFTPKGLLLRIASAAEAYPDDKAATIQLMSSSAVSANPGVKSIVSVLNSAIKKSKAA